MERYTEHLWQSIGSDIWPAILAHPFLEGLCSGELPQERFAYYVYQDAAYLAAFGRGLAVLAARREASPVFMTLCEHARNTLVVEAALHREFMAHWEDSRISAPRELQPMGALYTGYLLDVAYSAPYPEALAAFLPCYMIYHAVGHHLVARGSPHPLYSRWIATYAGDAFAAVVAQIREHADAVALPLGDTGRAAMRRHFRKTSQLEYLFWDAAYRDVRWPFGDAE